VPKSVHTDFCLWACDITGEMSVHPDGLGHEEITKIAQYYDATDMVDYFGSWVLAVIRTILLATPSIPESLSYSARLAFLYLGGQALKTVV